MSQPSPTIIEENRWLLRYFASKNPFDALWFTAVLAAALFAYGYQPAVDTALVATAKIAFGVFYWTFWEYYMHRTFYHWKPKSERLRRITESFHIFHHRDPHDAQVLNAGPALAVALALVFGAPLALVTQSLKATSLMLVGTTAAYYVYEWVHYTVHMRVYTRGWLAYMQRFHLYHHDRAWNACFGVTNPFWDMIFGTSIPRKTVMNSVKVEKYVIKKSA